jgi:hypothetical protein
LDDLFTLKELGLQSSVLMTLGYRDIKTDYLVIIIADKDSAGMPFIGIIPLVTVS